MRSTFGARVMRFLTDLPGPVVFAGFLVWFIVWSIAAAVVFDLTVPVDSEANLALVAGPIIPALGAMFAFLAAFAINTEWVQLRQAQNAADLEADSAARFALIAESPGLDGPMLRRDLQRYLRHVVEDEWPQLPAGRGSQRARDALAEIFRETREIVAAPDIGQVSGTDLLQAVDSMVSLRRDRLSLARRYMPPALLLLTFFSGVVLCLDAVLVALPHQQWVSVTVGGIVILTALALALVVAVSAPYRGTISVEVDPIAIVLDEVTQGDLGAIGPP